MNQMKKSKVLHLLQSSHFSGAENVVCQIIDMFKDDNIEMVYCSRDGQIREALKERDVIFLPLTQFSIQEVKKVMREYNPDIIHAHDAYASFIAAIVGEKCGIISHIHCNHNGLNRLSIKSLLYLWGSKKFRHIFWVSDSAYNDYCFKRHIASTYSTLYNVLNIDEVLKKKNLDVNKYDYDVVYVGRLSYQKNPERLIRVISLAIKINPKIKMAIIGIGDLLETTKKLSEDLGVDYNISFLGYRNNPLKILHDAKVMLMTSRFEGTPMCALEAMALGVPIVSTPTDGLNELVINGMTGYLSDEDTVLAEKITRIVADRDLYKRLSSNSRLRAIDLMNLESYKNKINKVYMM